MKRLISNSFALFAVLFSFGAFAQNFEGKIEYKISYDDLDPKMEAYEAMLPKKMTFLVKGTKSKMTQPNAMGGKTVVILDQETDKSTVLIDMMGKKVALEREQAKNEGEENPEINYPNESKTIAGYESKKAVISDKDGNKATIWFTEDIPALDLNMGMEGLKGFPMEFENNQNGVSSKIVATKVSKEEVDDSEFEVPEEYEKLTPEEFQQMMQQGQ